MVLWSFVKSILGEELMGEKLCLLLWLHLLYVQPKYPLEVWNKTKVSPFFPKACPSHLGKLKVHKGKMITCFYMWIQGEDLSLAHWWCSSCILVALYHLAARLGQEGLGSALWYTAFHLWNTIRTPALLFWLNTVRRMTFAKGSIL